MWRLGSRRSCSFLLSRDTLERKKKKRDGVSAQRSCMQGVRGTKNFGESGLCLCSGKPVCKELGTLEKVVNLCSGKSVCKELRTLEKVLSL